MASTGCVATLLRRADSWPRMSRSPESSILETSQRCSGWDLALRDFKDHTHLARELDRRHISWAFMESSRLLQPVLGKRSRYSSVTFPPSKSRLCIESRVGTTSRQIRVSCES